MNRPAFIITYAGLPLKTVLRGGTRTYQPTPQAADATRFPSSTAASLAADKHGVPALRRRIEPL